MALKKTVFTQDQIEALQNQAKAARGAILKMTTLAKSGHPGGSMSTIDFLMTLYNMVNVDPKNPKFDERDKIVMSHGHVSPAVYSSLALNGFFDMDEAISQFRLAGSIYEGHVEPDVPGVEWASGNLGQGLSAGVGFALGARLKNIDKQVFVLMGDGEQQKGQIAEARRFAVKYKLNNVTAFIDYNRLQIGGDIEDVMPQNIRDGYLADGWDVIEIDGHNFEDIINSINDAVENERPTAIIAHTTMGKGVSFMEGKHGYHGAPISEEQLAEALVELGLENNLDELKEMRKNFVPKKHEVEMPTEFEINTGKPIVYTSTTDNRSAWGNAIADIASLTKNAPVVVLDNDLQGSVKTNKFEEISDYYFECGITEHHTAVMGAALSVEGFQVYFPGFGVFGVDETYNMHRLSDINRTNLKVITTHVGLDVGEDGKTHQCIDYLGLMKNLYHFHVVVPADPNQTDQAIRYVTGKYGNFLVPMGRSKLNYILDAEGNIFFGENYEFVYGKADLLREGTKAALLVMGTLTNRAVEAADKLKAEGVDIQVWNVSCPTALDEDALRKAATTGTVFTYEDHNVNTGLGNSVADKMMQMGLACKFVKFGVEDYAFSGNSADVYRMCNLDADSIYNRIKENI